MVLMEAKPDGGAGAAPPAVVYYPSHDTGVCIHDGLEPDWLRPEEKADNVKDCCDHSFGWSDKCILESEVADMAPLIPGVQYYPSSELPICLADGNQPAWLSDSLYNGAQDCCDSHYGWSTDCTSNSLNPAAYTLAATTAPVEPSESISIGLDTVESLSRPDLPGISVADEISVPEVVLAIPVASPNALASNFVSVSHTAEGKFFPVFINGETKCSSSGTPPAWLSGDFLEETKSGCCQKYAFQWDYAKCLKAVTSDAHAFASNTLGEQNRSFYPSFRHKTCSSDGENKPWMAGDYLAQNEWECCHNMFRATKLQDKCLKKSGKSDSFANVSHDTEATAANVVKPAQIEIAVQTITAATALPQQTTTSTIISAPETSIQNTADDSVPQSSNILSTVESVLKSHQDEIDNKILVYQTPKMVWEPSSLYRFKDLLAALRIMASEGVAGKKFYVGEGNNHVYGLVNIAAFLAQSMKETIMYNACDENSWDTVGDGYPLSNACGQLGQSYQDYTCAEHEKHMECPIKKDMTITATTHATWWGAPAPLFCAPKKKYPTTGYWDHRGICDDAWADVPMKCEVYEGQKGGEFNNDSVAPNTAGRTDVEGCCWWGRGVIQTTGRCNFGKLNYYLGAGAAKEGRKSKYSDIDFCEQPDAICASEEHKELKWIAGMFYWVESLQSYSVDGWDYITELKKFVDNGMLGDQFINAVSGIVNRGCHNPPCATGNVDGGSKRASNFQKVLTELGV